MGKLAFLFPGQGSQYVGMGKELAEKFPDARNIFKQADAVLDYPLSQLCFSGPKEELTLTENTQPAVLTTTIAILRVLQSHDMPKPDYVAGHSLGEYSALVAASVLTFEDALLLVRRRGQFMEEAVAAGEGTMSAIIGLSMEQVEAVCRQARQFGVVEPANFNCPGQVVIAGEVAAVRKANELALEAGAKRAIQLDVSGPFHSSLMTGAAEKLRDELVKTEFHEPQVKVIANVNAEIINSSAEARENLVSQVNNPVRWQESMEKLISLGVDTFVEVGPGKVLTGLLKKIDRSVTMLNVEDQASLVKVLAHFER
ncbi:MAG: ACP S-malonyltransferase [Thermoanaerobacteraceae bacterium]|nr:ACP S-malonyltransferase [Thermoanaerobacteraceae bacterium]